MPAPRKHALAGYERILEVMRQRQSRPPSDKELAAELGCSQSPIHHVMDRARKGKTVPGSSWNKTAVDLDELARELGA